MIALFAAIVIAMTPLAGLCAPAGSGFFDQGITLYKAGRYSEAMEAFDRAVQARDHGEESQHYMEQIRKETVERIRNQALAGISKTNWQSKFYFIRSIENRLQVGISSQETFEPRGVNFRPGAADALRQLATTLQHNDNALVDLELISERPTESPENPELLGRRLAEIFSYLSLAAQDALPDTLSRKPLP